MINTAVKNNSEKQLNDIGNLGKPLVFNRLKGQAKKGLFYNWFYILSLLASFFGVWFWQERKIIHQVMNNHVSEI